MTRKILLSVALLALVGCTRDNPAPRRNRPTPPAAMRPAAPPPSEAVNAQPAPDASPAVVDNADAAVEPVAASDDGGAGERTFEGPGVRVVVRADQMVEVHTTDNWDAGVDQVFESCLFARNALPTLRRSIPSDRIDVLVEACGDHRAGEHLPALPHGNARPQRPAARPGAAR